MKIPRATSFLLTALMLLALLVNPPCLAQTKTFTNEAGGFEITLPSDWQEIPTNVIEKAFKRMSARITTPQASQLKFGYQRKAADRSVHLPYMMVEVNEQGPVAESDIAKAVQNKKLVEAVTEDAKNKAGNMLKGADINVSTYDPQRHMLRHGSHEQLPDGSEIIGTSATFLTSRGMLLFHFYANKNEFDALQDSFESAINSITLSPELAYSLPATPHKSGNRILLYALVGGCVGAVISLFNKFFISPRRQ